MPLQYWANIHLILSCNAGFPYVAANLRGLNFYPHSAEHRELVIANKTQSSLIPQRPGICGGAVTRVSSKIKHACRNQTYDPGLELASFVQTWNLNRAISMTLSE
jgi:hypothetical protein